MLRSVTLTAILLAIALGVGGGSVWLALDRDFEFDTVTVGSWTAFPARGTPQADPYSKARFSREADLALGAGEGLIFVARQDSQDQPLRMECDYLVRGGLPPARFWTLYARNPQGHVVTRDENHAPALHSLALLRQQDNTTVTTVSRNPAPGNWLATAGQGTFNLVLTLYDTGIASGARIDEIELPQVTRVGCDD